MRGGGGGEEGKGGGGGASSNVVSIICPPVGIGLTDLPKFLRGDVPVPYGPALEWAISSRRFICSMSNWRLKKSGKYMVSCITRLLYTHNNGLVENFIFKKIGARSY